MGEGQTGGEMLWHDPDVAARSLPSDVVQGAGETAGSSDP